MLWAFRWIKVFLIAILVDCLGQILSIFSFGVVILKSFDIDFGGQGKTFLSSAISFILLVIFDLFFLTLFKVFIAIRVLKSWGFLFLRLGFKIIRGFLLFCRLISFEK